MERDFNKILATEYSKKFDDMRYLCAVRNEASVRFDDIRKKMMVMSYYKYGPLKDNYGTYKCIDALGSMKKRLDKYAETGNTEFLADVANFAMIEFMNPSVKKTYEFATAEPTDFTAVGMMHTALELYKKTGSIDMLVVIANMAAQEFISPEKESAFYQPTDSGACEIEGFSINEIRGYDER